MKKIFTLAILSAALLLNYQPVNALETGYRCTSGDSGQTHECSFPSNCAQSLGCTQEGGCELDCEFFDNTTDANNPADANANYFYSCTDNTGQVTTCNPSASNDECNHLLSRPDDYNCVLVDRNTPENDTESASIPGLGPLIPTACTGPNNNLSNCGINEILTVAVNVSRLILGILGSVALVMFVYGGVIFLISAGSSQRVEEGRTIILNAVIGIVIVLFAWIAVNAIVAGLTGTDIANPKIFDNQAPL